MKNFTTVAVCLFLCQCMNFWCDYQQTQKIVLLYREVNQIQTTLEGSDIQQELELRDIRAKHYSLESDLQRAKVK